jgi:hypothetical protein
MRTLTVSNLRRAGYGETNPLNDGTLEDCQVLAVPMTTLSSRATEGIEGVRPADARRTKNLFALGLISWMYGGVRPRTRSPGSRASSPQAAPAFGQAKMWAGCSGGAYLLSGSDRFGTHGSGRPMRAKGPAPWRCRGRSQTGSRRQRLQSGLAVGHLRAGRRGPRRASRNRRGCGLSE